MSRGHIPERQPIADSFTGILLTSGEQSALALTPDPAAERTQSGTFILRYGVQLLGKPHLALIPGLLALDYGEMLTGQAAWEFLLKRSNLHPRADVLGYRNDGADEMLPVKWLDIVAPIQVFAYADESSTVPLLHLHALIADDAAVRAFPERSIAYLPRYTSASAWLEGQSQDE